MTIYDQLKTATTPLMAKFKNPTQGLWQVPTLAPAGGGTQSKTWSAGTLVNIIILPKSSATPSQSMEPLKADRLQSEIAQIIYVLYDDASAITAKDRIVFDGKAFNIMGIPQNIAEGNMWIKLTCKEGVAT